MQIQVVNTDMHLIASIGMLIYAFILLYTCICVYIGVFWLVYSPILHHLGQSGLK